MRWPAQYLVLAVLLLSVRVRAQKHIPDPVARPRLVVGIVVDQMRNDFIYRYWSHFGKGGFRRLVEDGYYFRNTHYNYIPTYTGPGHASIYTGATPGAHGIIANDWYNRDTRGFVYCVEDSTARTVGAAGKSGNMSPKNQLSSTVGDELKMSSNGRGKVYAVALKDRSAVLPAGHAADGAFWFDDASGGFVSSTWYMLQLPSWLQAFNANGAVKNYLQQGWNLLQPAESYSASIADDNAYEGVPNRKEKPVFPYDYAAQLAKGDYGIIKYTPGGNTLTKDLALACIINEKLGKDAEPDLLSISFSSTDLIAHAYGPRAMEVEDTYLRLDKDIEALLAALDKEVGKGNYTVFLTADHGGGDVPAHLNDRRIPAGRIDEKQVTHQLNHFFQSTWGDSSLLASFSNEQVFISNQRLTALHLDRNKVERDLSRFLVTLPGIAAAYPSDVLNESAFPEGDPRRLLQNGVHQRMSGNVCVLYAPGWMEHGKKGTTHGSGYNYDTHVPLIFYGKGVKKGSDHNYTTITQIAPTLCELLQINQPNATVAHPLNDVLR